MVTNDIIQNSNLTRLQWLRQTYLKYLRDGNDKYADFYHRLMDEAWRDENQFGGMSE